jgi:hypothetical protein
VLEIATLATNKKRILFIDDTLAIIKKMKKIIQRVFSTLALIVIVTSFSPMPASAALGVAGDSNGNISVGWGSSDSALNSVMGGYGAGGGWSLTNPYGLPEGSILGIASNMLFWLLAIFAILGVVGFVISGIFYLVAAGDEGMMDKGKEGMKWAIMGIIIGLSGFIIMQAVNSLLGGASKTF